MHLKRFDGVEDKVHLVQNLHDYFLEMHGKDYVDSHNKIETALESMFKMNRTIYYIYHDNTVIGFIVLYINDQYGLVTPTVTTEYMYVAPAFRSGKAILMLYTMVGMVCDDLGVDCISTTYLSSSNTGNNITVGAVPIATVNYFPRDKFNKTLTRYKKRLGYTK